MGRRKGPGLTRTHVVDAALALVLAEGPDALGVSRVARDLGIKPPSIYNHVGKGDALARAVALEGHQQLLATLDQAVDASEDPRHTLMRLALCARTWIQENRGLYTLMARIQPDNDEPEFAALLERTLALFARPLTRMGVANEHTLHAIRGLRAAMHGFVLLEGSGQFQLSASTEQSYRWLIEAILEGLDQRAPGVA